jgi:tRNA-2-methylthio-N6-dimethylallyladenosine synthase
VAQSRFDRLAALVRSLSLASNERAVGETVACLVEGASRRDARVLSARTPHNRLVHVPLPDGHTAARHAGLVTQVRITGAHPWFLTGELADRAV